jgi:ACS family hexuronate transporter-like MFS transporter
MRPATKDAPVSIRLQPERYKWRIISLLFFAMMINYVDRNVMSFVMVNDDFKRTLLGLRPIDPLGAAELARFKEIIGLADMVFKIAYASGFLLVGWLIDKLGTYRGFKWAVGVWSIAAMAHTAITGAWGLMAARFTLGLGEAGGMPTAIKTISEWFPQSERSLATGILNAGVNVGILITASLVPFLVESFGWRVAFLVTGSLGIVTFFLWKAMYHPYPVPSGTLPPPPIRVSWGTLLRLRQTWVYAAGKFLTDPVWWFFLTWLPTFFNENKHFAEPIDLKNLTGPFLIIYFISDIGSVFFGWLATSLQKRGWSANLARKSTLLLTALCVVPIFLVSTTTDIAFAVALLSLATAGHQGWSSNLQTLPSDLFPQEVVGSVSGIGATFGAIGGILLAGASGFIINRYGYAPLFMGASVAYLLAWLVLVVSLPKLRPVRLDFFH